MNLRKIFVLIAVLALVGLDEVEASRTVVSQFMERDPRLLQRIAVLERKINKLSNELRTFTVLDANGKDQQGHPILQKNLFNLIVRSRDLIEFIDQEYLDEENDNGFNFIQLDSILEIYTAVSERYNRYCQVDKDVFWNVDKFDLSTWKKELFFAAIELNLSYVFSALFNEVEEEADDDFLFALITKALFSKKDRSLAEILKYSNGKRDFDAVKILGAIKDAELKTIYEDALVMAGLA